MAVRVYKCCSSRQSGESQGPASAWYMYFELEEYPSTLHWLKHDNPQLTLFWCMT